MMLWALLELAVRLSMSRSLNLIASSWLIVGVIVAAFL